MSVRRNTPPRRVPLPVLAVLAIPIFFLANWCYHAARKPSEVVGIFDAYFFKDPQTTWKAFGSIFRTTSTDVISPELLAALAQVESRGNSIATTYWTWKWSWNPFRVYSPASSSVGLFQLTDGTFDEARHLCIHQHRVRREGPWYDWDSCWLTFLYNRLIPGHSAEMTSAYLHTQVMSVVRRSSASMENRRDLAAVIHLCGPRFGEKFVQGRFRARSGARCGAHDVGEYLRRVKSLQIAFARLAH